MFDKDGKLDERSQRILSEQTIPPRYGLSPVMQALKREMSEEARTIMLERIGCGDGLFTEYEPEQNWKTANYLAEIGFIEGKGLLTGTTRFKITEAGRSIITTDEG